MPLKLHVEGGLYEESLKSQNTGGISNKGPMWPQLRRSFYPVVLRRQMAPLILNTRTFEAVAT